MEQREALLLVAALRLEEEAEVGPDSVMKAVLSVE
jgi:hypothetical protein